MYRLGFIGIILAVLVMTGTFPTMAQDTSIAKDEYGGWTQIKSNATGFFRVAQMKNTWWAVTPAGNGFFAIGTDHVNYTVHGCEALGYAPYAKNVQAKFNNDETAWAKSSVERLKGWNFSLLGANNSPSTRGLGMAYAVLLTLGTDFATKDGLVKKTVWTGFPDVFNPEFQTFCEQQAEAQCAKLKDDPWLFGYFLDNELEWLGKFGSELALAEEAIKKPADDPAKKAFVELLKAKYSTIKAFKDAWNLTVASWDDVNAATDWNRNSPRATLDKQAFVRLAAEKYFTITTVAIRKFDPNHMILGCRFAGRAPSVLDIAGKYCDVISLNLYSQVDLDKEEATRLATELRTWYAKCKRPLMISEWSFPALDAGLPCRHGAGQRVATQKERALAFEVFQKALCRLPFVVGSDYFMWVDEPAQGISKTFPEDGNYGLVDVNDRPYPELTQTATRVNALAYDIHSGRSTEVGIPPGGTGIKNGLVAVLVRGQGANLPATVDVKFQADGESRDTRIEITSGALQTVSFQTSLGRGAHYIQAALDPNRKLVEADRSDNTLREMIYDRPEGWKEAEQYDTAFRIPIGVYSASPTVGKHIVTVPLLRLNLFEAGRMLTVDALRLEDAEGRPTYFEIYDLDSSKLPSDADDLVFQATLGGGRMETYYLWVGRTYSLAGPGGKFVSATPRSEFQLDNGKLKLTKTSQSGVMIDSVALGDTRLGFFETLIKQTNGGVGWLKPNRLRDISLLQGDLLTRVIVGCDYVPTEQEKLAGRRSFLTYCMFEFLPDKPWFAAQIRSLYNTDTEPWLLGGYFYYAESSLGDDGKDDEVASLGLPMSGGWRDPTSGAVFGLLGTQATGGNLQVTFWKDEDGRQHPDAYVAVNRQIEPTKAFDIPGPRVYVFGALPKGDEKPWNDIRDELRQQPICETFKPEVEAGK